MHVERALVERGENHIAGAIPCRLSPKYQFRIPMFYFNLDENNNVVECEQKDWCDLCETKDGQERRRVGWDEVNGYEVSTVFLGLDHGFTGRPLLFETMIFGKGDEDGYQIRCSTWDEAVEMHKEAIDWIKNGCKDE